MDVIDPVTIQLATGCCAMAARACSQCLVSLVEYRGHFGPNHQTCEKQKMVTYSWLMIPELDGWVSGPRALWQGQMVPPATEVGVQGPQTASSKELTNARTGSVI